MTCKNCKEKISVVKPQMGNIAPEEKKEKSPGVDNRQRQRTVNDLGEPNRLVLENKAVLTE